MTRITAALALTAALVGITAGAQAGVLPGHGTHLGVHCTVHTADSRTTVRANTSAALPVRVIVTNNARTRTVDFRDVLTDGTWTHGVWHTYTDKNVQAWVAGTPCAAN